MNWKYDYDWNDNHNAFETFLEKFEDGLQVAYNATINKILDKRKDQKIKVRIDGYDIWSMDHTLSNIVTPMLQRLKENKHGSPWVDDEDVPEELRSTAAPPKEHEWDTDDNHEKRWDWVLNEMIWAFEQKQRDHWESDYYKYESDPTETLGLKLVWEDREGRAAHQARMSNGFKLFGKYYEALWD
jgi:viroplasmin and RNaseH domain-containing protein